MKKTLTRALCALLVALMCVTAFVACNGNKKDNNYAANNTEIYIGVSGPLTGGAGVYGQAVENGAKMAVEEINANGGVSGIKLKLVAMDDQHKAENVPTNYSTMLEAGMQVSLGCVTTNPCLEFKALSNEDNVFFMTPSASANAVVEYENAYQMCFADGNQGSVAAKYVNDNFKGQTIGMLYKSDDAYSTGIREQFLATLDKTVTVVEASFNGDVVASFESQINTLKNCKFIFMPIYYGPASQFMTEAKDTIAKDAVYYGCDGLDGIDTAVEGFDINTIPQEVSFLSHFNSKATDGAAGEFITKYVAKFGKDTLNQFGASAYDCVYAIAKALDQPIKNGELTVTSSASEFCDVLKKVFQGGFTFTGVTGENVTWDANGYVQKSAIKYVVKASSK